MEREKLPTADALLGEHEVGLDSDDVRTHLLDVLLLKLQQACVVLLAGDLQDVPLEIERKMRSAGVLPTSTLVWLSPFLYSMSQSSSRMRGFSILYGQNKEG